MFKPKIFVINLARSTERKRHMERVLGSLPLEYEFVEAVDASDLTDEYIREVYDDVACRRNIRRPLAKTEIACALSHIKVWELMLSRGLEDVFVMEDDVYVKDEEAFLEVLKAKYRYPKKWELILFGNGNSKVTGRGTPVLRFTRRDVWGRYGAFKFDRVAWGAWGYLISSKGARKLLKRVKPLKSTIDNGYTGTPRFVRLYGISPVLVEESPFGWQSTISKEREPLLHNNRLLYFIRWEWETFIRNRVQRVYIFFYNFSRW